MADAKRDPTAFAVELISSICAVSADPAFASSSDGDGSFDPRLLQALKDNSTPQLFDWMMDIFSFQGISDSVASSYLDFHGNATWREIKAQLARRPNCPLLSAYWTFEGCRYDKTRTSCSHPDRIGSCPLPKHRLRNGRLNQTAFSLYFFIRDQAGSDLFGWIDDQLCQVDASDTRASQEALIGPMRHIYGVSDKVLAMTLSSILMAASPQRPSWFGVGSQMIVIDTLVHNWLGRTGILAGFDAGHAYGPQCYQPDGCAEIIKLAAARIDGRKFNSAYPATFPRFIQNALWRYCAADELNICNANNIDNYKHCDQSECVIFEKCSKNSVIISKKVKY